MKRPLTAIAIAMYSISATPVSNDRAEQEHPYNLLGTPGYSTPAAYKAKILRSEERMRQVEERQAAYENGVEIRQSLREHYIDLRSETKKTILLQRIHDREQQLENRCEQW